MSTRSSPSYETVLRDLAAADERIVVMTAENRAAIRRLPEALGERFIDTGINEQTLVGASAGLALRGRVPVVHALATFLTMRAFEFIRTDVGIPGLPVKLIGYVPGLLSEANGPTHQALEDVALMRTIPGMRIFCPGDEADLLLGLPAVLADSVPWYVRFNARRTEIRHSPFAIGRAEVIHEGSDVGILACGALLQEAAEAADLLHQSGVSARLVNVRTLEPLDEWAVVDTIGRCRLVVTVEDHFVRGGLFSAVAELLVRRGIPSHVTPIGLEGWFPPAMFPDVLTCTGFRCDLLADRIRELLNLADSQG
ncbi:MAG TPA: transketolase C-terminal domain-containing protein [Thermoanaerobaculaceae bacterium]|nr:transketolase C-terminal domain-containing protein [Thermoanaerobaculaceae bacterium]